MAGSLSGAKSNVNRPSEEYSEKSAKKESQVEVPDRSRICPDQWQRTRGASCVQNYTVCKHGWTHDGLDMNAQKFEHESTKVSWMHESLNMNARKMSCAHDQTFARSFPDHRTFIPDFCAFMSRISCVHQTEKIYLLGCSADPWRWTQRVQKFHKSRYLKSFL